MAKRDWQGMTALEALRSVEGDPAASRWLKDAVRSALPRDPVKCANECEWLAAKLRDRAADLLEEMRSAHGVGEAR